MRKSRSLCDLLDYSKVAKVGALAGETRRLLLLQPPLPPAAPSARRTGAATDNACRQQLMQHHMTASCSVSRAAVQSHPCYCPPHFPATGRIEAEPAHQVSWLRVPQIASQGHGRRRTGQRREPEVAAVSPSQRPVSPLIFIPRSRHHRRLRSDNIALVRQARQAQLQRQRRRRQAAAT